MDKRILTDEMISQYRQMLMEEEKSPETVKKYCHDVTAFQSFMGGQELSKEAVIDYKRALMEDYDYTACSVNTALSALNGFFKRMGWYEFVVKALKIQTELFRAPGKALTKEDYYRLLETAARLGKVRLYLVMLTLCSTGIRVSELSYITVEAVNKGYAQVSLKGKIRRIILTKELRTQLKAYIAKSGRKSGSVFVTRSGKPLNRSNIWREMKNLCEAAGVEKSKVFPHNLRHLFACAYLEKSKDIDILADLLGHSSLNTTRIYTRRPMEEQARLISDIGLVVEMGDRRLSKVGRDVA